MNRWGAGTCKERPVDSVAAKEMEKRLAEIKAARDALDARLQPTQPATNNTSPNGSHPYQNPSFLVSGQRVPSSR